MRSPVLKLRDFLVYLQTGKNKSKKKMNVIVTGANGQLGKEIKKIVSMGTCKNTYIFVGRDELDITNELDVNRFFSDRSIGVIINCAAYTNVEKAQTDRTASYEVNAMGPMHLAFAAEDNNAVLMHISTDYVFSYLNPLSKPLPTVTLAEDLYIPARPDDCYYGWSKLAGERHIRNAHCKYFIFRTSWLYSPNENNFVSKMFSYAQSGVNRNVVIDQIGSPTNAADLAGFLVRIIETEKHLEQPGGIFNFCNGGVASWYDIATEVYRMCGRRAEDVTPCLSSEFPSNVLRPSYSVLSYEKTQSAFGVPQRYWRDSLEDVVEELKEKAYRERMALNAENAEYDYGHNVNYEEK